MPLKVVKERDPLTGEVVTSTVVLTPDKKPLVIGLRWVPPTPANHEDYDMLHIQKALLPKKFVPRPVDPQKGAL